MPPLEARIRFRRVRSYKNIDELFELQSRLEMAKNREMKNGAQRYNDQKLWVSPPLSKTN